MVCSWTDSMSHLGFLGTCGVNSIIIAPHIMLYLISVEFELQRHSVHDFWFSCATLLIHMTFETVS